MLRGVWNELEYRMHIIRLSKGVSVETKLCHHVFFTLIICYSEGSRVSSDKYRFLKTCYSFCVYTKSEQYLITGAEKCLTGPFKFSTVRLHVPNNDRQIQLSVFDKQFYSTRVRYTTRFYACSTPHVIRVSNVYLINNKTSMRLRFATGAR